MTFHFPQKVLFRHCDPAGIVFYPRYFEMINDCVEAFFDAVLGCPFESLHGTGAVPTVALETTFPAKSRHGDRLDLALTCERVGRTSLGLKIAATCGGETRFTSRSTLVFVDASGRPAPWPDAVRARLAEFTEGPEQ